MESNHMKRPRGLGRGLETLLGGDSPLHTERSTPSDPFAYPAYPASSAYPASQASPTSPASEPLASLAAAESASTSSADLPADTAIGSRAIGSPTGGSSGGISAVYDIPANPAISANPVSQTDAFADGRDRHDGRDRRDGRDNAADTDDDMPIHLLRISDIEPNPHQPRSHFDEASLQTLAESIRDNGLLQPLVVRRRPDENGAPAANAYQLIAGERRWRACRRAGLTEAPAIIMDADDLKMTELALIENLQRENLNPLEEADSYRILMNEFGLSQSETAARVGKSRPAIANAVRLLSLPYTIQEYVRSGELSAGHARALLMVEEEADCQKLAERIVREALNVRQTEKLAAAWKEHHDKAKESLSAPEQLQLQPITEADVDHFAVIRKELSGLWGRKVDFREKNGKRFVTLEYYDAEDLEGLIENLSKLKP